QRGHGTTVCGILVGDATLGDCLEGVTSALVECRRVYRPDPDAPSNFPKGMIAPRAYKRACEKLLLDRNAIAVLEVAEQQPPGGPLGRPAARLYEAGLAVVAAAGNGYSGFTPALNWIGSPGSHPWVISVGGAVTNNLSTEPNQSRGAVG